MKILLILIFLSCSFDCISKSVFGTTSNALLRTKVIKNFVKRTEKRIKDKVPESITALTIIGIQQRIELPIDSKQKFNIDYREKSVSYTFNFGF